MSIREILAIKDTARRTVTSASLLMLTTVVFSTITLISVSACNPSEKKTFVIGYVNPNTEEGAQGFFFDMQKYGYVEGQNMTYIRCESSDKKRIEDALRDMVAKKVDLIVTMTTPATLMAKRITEGTNIPVLFVMYDAVGAGIVSSLVNHGGNITGVQLTGSTPKTLEWLLAIRPRVRHIWVPVCFDTGAAYLSLQDLKQGAAQLGLQLSIVKVDSEEELRASLSSMPKDIDAIFMVSSWLVGCNFKEVLASAVKMKMPILSAEHVHLDDGLLLSYGPRYEHTGRQVARLADRILHGIPAAELPVETADFFLGINLKTAKAIRFEVPSDILQQADFIVREQKTDEEIKQFSQRNGPMEK